MSGPTETCAAPKGPRIICECGDPSCQYHVFALACVAWMGIFATLVTVFVSVKYAAPAWVFFGFNSFVWIARCVRLGGGAR